MLWRAHCQFYNTSFSSSGFCPLVSRDHMVAPPASFLIHHHVLPNELVMVHMAISIGGSFGAIVASEARTSYNRRPHPEVYPCRIIIDAERIRHISSICTFVRFPQTFTKCAPFSVLPAVTPSCLVNTWKRAFIRLSPGRQQCRT